jgi:hypothetical protein
VTEKGILAVTKQRNPHGDGKRTHGDRKTLVVTLFHASLQALLLPPGEATSMEYSVALPLAETGTRPT